ncbi:hypothetical protein [Chryseobacterium geocarposphaerae]|uniref:Uncharacterized protein n=1 Tax=Chryseobacterium geocarposphaerae TaxID=1416776 RepID=A0A2M9CBI2_9FLAO|nr:hypothetical protein [Chryseobacterium geocarposphaerae]PJJ68144.1 hypothetical protein CLV73_2179 [Chryseobacterium geocarposphaerae]
MQTSLQPTSLTRFEKLLLIPSSINIEELKESANSYDNRIDYYKLVSLISLITSKTVSYNIEKDRYYSYKKIKIHSNQLKKCCGNNYKIYYNFLSEINIFSKRSPYSRDEKGETFGYGFASNHLYKRLKFIKINTSEPTTDDVSFNSSYTKKYERILYKQFDRTRFSIDFNLAEERLSTKYLGNINYLNKSDSARNWEKYSSYHGALKQLFKFLNGDYKFTRKCKRYERKPSGRFYSPLTSLNKIIRNLLYYDGKKLQQLDVKNMFPYLLSNYLPEIAILNSKRIDRLRKCTAFNAKYNVNKKLKTKDYLQNNWAEESTNKIYTHFSSVKSKKSYSSNSLIKKNVSHYLFSAKTKSLFQYRDSHFQESSKNFYSLFKYDLYNEKQNKGHYLPPKSNFNLLSQKRTKSNIFPKGYTNPEDLYIKNHLATLYTGTLKSLKICNSSDFLQKICSSLDEYSYYISTKTLETLMNKEIKKFNTLSAEGVIYDHFIEAFMNQIPLIEWAKNYEKLFNENYNYTYGQDRALTKKLFISMLYARNNHYIREQQIFKSEFPIIYDLIREKKKDNYKTITHQLFDLESEIIVDSVARSLIKQGISTFTIHDCIAVPEQEIEASKLTLNNAFITKFGNCPRIELE